MEEMRMCRYLAYEATVSAAGNEGSGGFTLFVANGISLCDSGKGSY